mgnify:CR=1 FL=1
MKAKLLLYIILSVSNYYQSDNGFVDKNMAASNDVSFNNFDGKIDSVTLLYWNAWSSDYFDYMFSYSFNTMEMVVYAERWRDSHIVSIDSESQKIKFVSAINDFYIEKNTPIIDRKIKNAGDEHVEYEIPTFSIEFFKNGKILLMTHTSLGDGDYELMFNPKFEEFKNMIISIVDEYDKHLKKLQNGDKAYRCRYY